MSNSISKIDTSNNNIELGSAISIYQKDYYTLSRTNVPFSVFDTFMSRYDNRFLEILENSYNPSTLNPTVWYDDESLMYSDTEGTTLVTADNSEVRRINDRSGNGIDATLISGRTAATLKTNVYGLRCIRASDSAMTLGEPEALLAATNGTDPFTILAFFKRNTTDDFFLFTKGAGGGRRVGFSILDGAWGNYLGATTVETPTGTSQPHTYGYSIYQPGEPGASYSSGCQRLFLAGAAFNSRNTATLVGAESGTPYSFLGWPSPFANSYAAPIDLLAFMVVPRAMLPHEIVQWSDYYYEKFGVTNPRLTTRNIIWVGNSLSTVITGGSIPELVRQELSMPLGSIHNLAVGGMRTDEITAEGSMINSLKDYLADDPIYVLWEGSNQVQTTDAAIQTECEARIASGFSKSRIVIGTVLPRNDSGFNTTRNTGNTDIITNYANYAGQLADVGNDTTIGLDAAATNAAYYSDGVHLTAAGNFITTPYFVDAINLTNNIEPQIDSDAQAWVDLIELEGVTVSEEDKDAINTCVIGLKAIDYWDDIYSMGLFWFGNETANSVRAKIGGNITFPAGTRTHNIDYLKFSGNGYANLGFAPDDTGMTAGGSGLGVSIVAVSTPASDVCDIGSSDGGYTNPMAVYSSFGSISYGDCGSATGGRLSANPSSGLAGHYHTNRLSAEMQLVRQHSGGLQSIASRSDASGGGMSAANICIGALNRDGVTQAYSNRPYSFWLVQNTGVSQAKLELALPIIYTMLATRGLGTVVNSPVTNLLITEAQDDGNEANTINFTATWTKPYTTSFGRVRVTVNDVTVYEEDQDISSETISLTGIAAVLGDEVDIYIAVLGTTGHTAPSSDWVTDGDVVAEDLDPDVIAYAAEIDADSSITLTSEQQQLLSDWILAGDTNGWRPHVTVAMFLCWNNLQANLVRFGYGGNGSAVGTPLVNPKSMGLDNTRYINTDVTDILHGFTINSIMMCYSDDGAYFSGGGSVGYGNQASTRLFATDRIYFDSPTARSEAGPPVIAPIRMGVRNGNYQAIYMYNGTTVSIHAERTDTSGGTIPDVDLFIGYDFGTYNYTAGFGGPGLGMTSTIAGDFLIDTYTLLEALGAL